MEFVQINAESADGIRPNQRRIRGWNSAGFVPQPTYKRVEIAKKHIDAFHVGFRASTRPTRG
ncbi:hypothetical protein C6497_16075 [Candidatus Poribacteria bacterium]|nr:MAG: hypothetical protein C6497_16075 [Candidatus Poribacteria bacterium]